MSPETCSCDTQKPYSECCEPMIRGSRVPETALDLMRARYTAYARHEIDFIMKTLSPARKKDTDRESTEAWSRETEWEGFTVLTADKGGPRDDRGSVEFMAKFRENGELKEHHELATFVKRNGHWVFEDGRMPPAKTVKSEGPKIGRNDACPCGSGKKYKKCHGNAEGG